MADFMSYDPWANISSRNGIPGDELVSALQKSIRRGLEQEACMIAYEMYITSLQFEEKLWRRLQAISVEDVGYGNLDAPNLILTLNQMRKNFPYNDGDRPLFFVHAIRILCQSKKDRSSDHLKNLIVKQCEQGATPEIPDFAYDMHTRKGIEMGRDFKHFLEHGSKVTNEIEVNNTYKEKLLKLLEEIKEKDPKDGSFQFNSWQA